MPVSKRPRDGAEPAEPSLSSKLSAEELAAILAQGEDVPSLNAEGVKRLILSLERAVTANAALRAKHPTEPLKYLDSEVRLSEALKALQGLAAAPEHYPALPRSGALATLLGLLGHENTDIAVGVFEALGELLGGDDEEGAAEAAAGQLVDALGADGGLEQVLQGVARLGAAVRAVEAVGGGGGGEMSAVETDNMARDAEGLLAALSLAGRAVALRPALAKEVLRALPTARGTPLLLDTLFAQLQPGAFSEVKGAAAELVCDVLAMGGLEAARAVGGGAHTFPRRAQALSGTECLLEALAPYRKRGPEGVEEKEFVSNLFDALCTCLLQSDNVARFFAAEGTELMLRLVAGAGFARYGALKACATALPSGGRAACEGFVSAGGLKTLFPALMGQGASHTRALHGARAARDEGEYAATLLAALLTWLPRAPAGAQPAPGAGLERLRVLGKFREGGGEKMQRLVELRVAVAARVAAASAREEGGQGGGRGEGGGEEEAAAEREAAWELRRLDAGLFTRQRLDICLGRLLTEPAALREKAEAPARSGLGVALEVAEGVAFGLREKLHEQGASVVDVLVGLQEYEEALPLAAGEERSGVAGMIKALAGESGLDGGAA